MAFRVLQLTKTSIGIWNVRNFCSGAKPVVGFIGLGQMGHRMAKNMLEKGYPVNVFDISDNALEVVKERGAKVFNSPTELSTNSKYVVTMLPNNQIVTETYEEIVKNNGVKPDTMFIDSSTVDPSVSQYVQKIISAKGAQFVDAPVSGGVMGAENATLTFMVGGTTEEYEKVKPVLEGMGRKITHCGKTGMGEAAKLCNNMMLAISMIGTAETMNLAIRLGLDPKVFNEIINVSTGRSWSSEVNNPVPGLNPGTPPSNNYEGGFSTALITKDLGLASSVATASNSPIPLGALSHQIYRTLIAKGLANKDFSVVYDFIKNEGK
jgi:3-hydroxyisobutyrate dehydrogenase